MHLGSTKMWGVEQLVSLLILQLVNYLGKYLGYINNRGIIRLSEDWIIFYSFFVSEAFCLVEAQLLVHQCLAHKKMGQK